MKQFRLFLITVVLNISAFSQQYTERFNNFQTDFFVGQHLEHDTSLKDAIQGNSFGVLLSYNYTNTKSSKFNTLFNYPERGYSLLYHNLNSDILGEIYAGYRHFTYNLTPDKRNPLKLTTGFGVGYATKKFDELTNPKNFAIGSNILASGYVKLHYLQFIKGTNLSLNSSVSLVHFSNVAFKNPNLGLNTFTLNLGFNYRLNAVSLIPKIVPNTIDKSIYYNLIFRTGFNESKQVGSGLYPFYNLGFYGAKKINSYSTLTGGTELFISKFLKHYTEIENDNTNTVRSGIFVGHELTQYNFAFISQLGVYVYYPKEYESRVYERFGFKYKLGKHLFSEVTLKANLFRAEALELGIGYRF